jgi:Xaa-Pro aminopeptidase
VVTPGETTERDVADWMRARLWEMDLDPAWDIEGCPNVWTHPRGHGGPSDAVIQGGDTLSVDFGIRLIGYCTDLQRTAYVLRPGEAEIPEDIARMWETVVASNRAAVEAMRPGVTGCDVDAAARAVVVEAGYEAYPHATGHVVGFLAHEIGPLLGPDWPDRYGKTVHRTLDAGQIYAVEPAVSFSRHGVGGPARHSTSPVGGKLMALNRIAIPQAPRANPGHPHA